MGSRFCKCQILTDFLLTVETQSSLIMENVKTLNLLLNEKKNLSKHKIKYNHRGNRLIGSLLDRDRLIKIAD